MSNGAARIILRLDDGSIVGVGESPKLAGAGASGPAIIRAEAAFALGLLQDADEQRLQNLLVQVHARAGTAQPLRSVPSTSAGQNGLYDAQSVPEAYKDTNGSRGLQRFDSGSPGASGGNWAGTDFLEKCQKILESCRSKLNSFIFDKPVDSAAVPDYYTIIHRPMDFSTARSKLSSAAYTSPQEFYEDMKLIWTNCWMYNGKLTPYGKVGTRFEDTFEQAWAGSGFAQGSRHRRATAGVAADKYEPHAVVLDKKMKKQPSLQHKNSKGFKGALMLTNSSQPWSRQRTESVAHAVEKMCSTSDSIQAEILTIISEREKNLGGEEGGEVELDFEKMSIDTLAELEMYVRRHQGGEGAASDFDDSETDDD